MEYHVMNDLQLKINKIIQILSSDLPKPEKALMALQGFSALDITHFNQVAKKRLYKHLGAVNEVLSHYPDIKEDNYHIISNKHLNDILNNIQSLCLAILPNALT